MFKEPCTLDMQTLPTQLTQGYEARLEALAALPVPTANHWEMLICLMHDLGRLRDSLRQEVQP